MARPPRQRPPSDRPPSPDNRRTSPSRPPRAARPDGAERKSAAAERKPAGASGRTPGKPVSPYADKPRGRPGKPIDRAEAARATDRHAKRQPRPAAPERPDRRPDAPPEAVRVRGAPAQMSSARADGLHRIAKLLARAGVASRRDIERMISDGRVALNGVIIDTPATLLDSVVGITVDGNPVEAPEASQLFLFHKPAGCLTAARDPGGRRTIYDVLPPGLPRLVPVGRLDLNTEGLLLMTTDGALKRRLELPSSGVERTYRARAFGEVSQAQLEDLVEGVTIEGMRYGRIDANLERRTGRNTWIEMTLTEGKNREVRRVLEHLGLKVARLIRTSYGPFVLGSSSPGQIEEASPRDVENLLRGLP